jgi:hypothetical protein
MEILYSYIKRTVLSMISDIHKDIPILIVTKSLTSFYNFVIYNQTQEKQTLIYNFYHNMICVSFWFWPNNVFHNLFHAAKLRNILQGLSLFMNNVR